MKGRPEATHAITSGWPTIHSGSSRDTSKLCRVDGVKWAGENLTEIAGVWLPEIMSLPDSLPWMESVDAKMVRAKEHLDTLHAEAGVFFESTKRNFILKSNGQEAWIVHYIEGSTPPIRLGVLLGECVFNIRSALDNLSLWPDTDGGFKRTVQRYPIPHLFRPGAVGKELAEVPQGC